VRARDLREQVLAGWQPQGERTGVADQAGGHGDQSTRRVRRRRARGRGRPGRGRDPRRTRRLSSRVVAGHQSGQQSVTATWALVISIASARSSSVTVSSGRHSGAIRRAAMACFDVGERGGAGELPGDAAGVRAHRPAGRPGARPTPDPAGRRRWRGVVAPGAEVRGQHRSEEVLTRQLRRGHPHRQLRPVAPRSRVLIGPIAASSRLITSRCSASSVIATNPRPGCRSSAAPSAVSGFSRTLPTRQVSFPPRRSCRRKHHHRRSAGHPYQHLPGPRRATTHGFGSERGACCG